MEKLRRGDTLIRQGVDDGTACLLLSGEAEIMIDDNPRPVGTVGPGEFLGELSILQERPHHATATAASDVTAAIFGRRAITALVRRRPDIGVVIFRNLATELGAKLIGLGRRISEEPGDG